MISNLKPYPVMKDSGVPWLGEVPEHWSVKRGKSIFSVSQIPVDSSDDIVTCFRDGQVTLRRNRRTTGFMMALKESGYQGVRRGQLVIHAMDAFAGAVGVSDSDGKCSPEYIVCNPRRQETVPAYFARVLRLAAHSKYIEVACSAVRERAPRLRFPNFGDMLLPVPTAVEQSAISRYLDFIDSRIRRYISAKQKLIKLLEEQKRVIIHRAVTRGIDQNTRLKPSGIEWLGDVPEHWELKKLKHLTRFHNGLAFKPSDWSASGVPIIRIQNLNGGNDFNYTTRDDLPSLLRIKPGDLLFSWSGNRGTSFGSFIWDRDFEGYLNQHIFKLDGYALDGMYFAYLLRAVTGHVEEQTHGIIGLVHITKPELGAVLVPVAPLEEQKAIADSIKKQITSEETSESMASRAIGLLREFRTRLIADVVTGKLDVREAVAKLPDKTGEADPFDEADTPVEDEDNVEGADLDAATDEVEA